MERITTTKEYEQGVAALMDLANGEGYTIGGDILRILENFATGNALHVIACPACLGALLVACNIALGVLASGGDGEAMRYVREFAAKLGESSNPHNASAVAREVFGETRDRDGNIVH